MTAALAPGTIVDRYQILGEIGGGSMGDVLRAVDVDLNRQVAIKILSERHRENAELRARFVREGRAVAAISHPNVVQVFTTGQFDGRPFIAMEMLDGVDLGSVVRQHGVMSSVQASRAALDAARGLDAAAKAGLIHRDIKPSNLMLVGSGVVKVTDFGLAKPLDPSAGPALTAMGVVVGTPDYIAPEQARGEEIDPRVDIYALGGTIYFLVTGSPPFRTGNPSEDKYLKVVARHLKEPPPDARAAIPSVDTELAALARRMMAKKAGERPSHPELIQTLAAIVGRLQAQSDAAGDVPSTTAAAVTAGSGGAPRVAEPTPYVGGASSPRPGEVAALVGGDGSARIDAGAAAAPPRASRWLVLVTVASALLFLTGLGLVLFGARTEAAAPAPPPDASASSDAAPALRSQSVAPPGMILVRRPDGTPWLYVDTAPVSHGAYAAVRPEEKQPMARKKQNALPAVSVSFDQALSFAAAAGKRLLRPEEWEAAAATPGFIGPGKLLEWVDDTSRGAQQRRAVRGLPDVQDKLLPGPHANVTFRLARDL